MSPLTTVEVWGMTIELSRCEATLHCPYATGPKIFQSFLDSKPQSQKIIGLGYLPKIPLGMEGKIVIKVI